MWNSGRLAQHQRDGVAALDAEPRQPAGERVDAVAQLAPGERDLVVLRADRDAVRDVLDGEAEGLGDRARRARGARPERRRPPCGRPYLTSKPSPVSRPMSFVKPDHEQRDHEREADEAGPLHHAERDRAAAHLLGQRPEDVAAVERQEREQVDDAERQRDDREQEERRARSSSSIAWRVTS